MATPRPAGPNKTQGKAKAPPFGRLSRFTKDKSGDQPPIPTRKAKSPSVGKGKPFNKLGKSGMAR